MNRTALIFDLDGTLVDSVPDLQAALNAMLAERRRAPVARAEVVPMVGDGIPALVERAMALRNIDQGERGACIARFLAFYEAEPTARSTLYPDARETLAALADAGYGMAVCTNKLQEATLAVLSGFGIRDRFAVVLGGDALPVKKPHPGHLLAAVERLGATPERSVMIGDHENDAAAARAAGLKLILMRHGYARVPLDSLSADRILDRFNDLPAILGEWGLTP